MVNRQIERFISRLDSPGERSLPPLWLWQELESPTVCNWSCPGATLHDIWPEQWMKQRLIYKVKYGFVCHVILIKKELNTMAKKKKSE